MNNKKIFFIPYAGASSMAYYKFYTLLKKYTDVVLLELAGRGIRTGEPFYHNIDEAAEDLSDIIASEISSNNDYFIYGHSMGALLAFEVYYKLCASGKKQPKHIFFSGRIPPQILFRERDISLHSDDDDELLERVSQFGGITDDFNNEEVRELFLPILRADFKILDDYIYDEKKEKIKCDVSVLYADDDFSTPYLDIEKWGVHTSSSVQFCRFHGGHFFVNTSQNRIFELILDVIKAS